MKLFNAFQVVAGFVAWPYLIAWLGQAEFRGAPAAFYSAAVLYIIAFGLMVGSVRFSMTSSAKLQNWPFGQDE